MKFDHKINWTGILVSIVFFLLSGILSACGQEPNMGQAGEDPDRNVTEQASDADPMETESSNIVEPENSKAAEQENAASSTYDNAKLNEIREMFGENCIAEQTFEVELSEYDGKVWFVPIAPWEENPWLTIQIIQDGEVLQKFRSVPIDAAEGKTFSSLDDVYFGDLNYDDCTDILLIETFGNIQFAKVYYGFDANAPEYDQDFDCPFRLCENIYLLADQMTVPCVVELLTNGKRNGEFTSWQEAYMEVSRLYELESGRVEDGILSSDSTYDLVDIDGDDIPELAAGKTYYVVSLYTFQDGTVYCLMDQWPYGAGGNSGYTYQPGENRFRNYDTGYAGLILYTTYMTINSQHTLESVTIKMINFDDRNGNGVPDGDEEDSAGEVCVIYKDGVKITDEEYEEEYAVWRAGEYEFLCGSMSYEDLQLLLSSTDVWQP